MKRAEFDKFAQQYRETHAENIRTSGEAPEYFAEYKARDLARVLDDIRIPGQKLRILDFGAGVGTSVSHVRRCIVESAITCLDVSLASLSIGQERLGHMADFVAFDGRALPVRSLSFDAAFAACVFHHIPAPDRMPLLSELRRILKPGGILMIYEHNPMNPLTRRAVCTCPFDENAELIRASAMRNELMQVGFRDPQIRFRVFFPRALAMLRPLEPFIGWLPLGAQYYLAAEK